MSKQPSRGHISVKGETYDAFKAACDPANIRMGAVLDELIRAVLDGDLTKETAYWAKLNADKLEAIKTRSSRYQNKAKKKAAYQPGTIEGVSPEYVLAVFHHEFSVPVIDPYHHEVARKLTKDDLKADDPYHVEVTPKKKPAFTDEELQALQASPKEQAAYRKEMIRNGFLPRAEVTLKPPPPLFSEEGLKMAEAALKNDPVTPPAHGKRAEGIISLSEAQSCIDPTFGKK